jgi:ribosome-associated protein
MGPLVITETVVLPETALEERFVRASGPGGQNVNKVSTAVELRYDPSGLPDHVRARLWQLAGRRAAKDGTIVLLAQRFRTQDANRQDARSRLAALVALALEAPPPPRIKTRPSRAARAKRVDHKVQRGQIKALRRAPDGED